MTGKIIEKRRGEGKKEQGKESEGETLKRKGNVKGRRKRMERIK